MNPLDRALAEIDIIEILELLIKHGANPNAIYFEEYGYNGPIINMPGSTDEKIRFLASKGADINLALSDASCERTASLLIELGADVNWRDPSGRTPLMKVTSPKVVETLIQAGADISASDVHGFQAIHLARSSLEKIKILMKAGADIHATDSYGRNLLHIYASNVYNEVQTIREIIEFLIQVGVDKSARNKAGITAEDQIRKIYASDPEWLEKFLNSNNRVN